MDIEDAGDGGSEAAKSNFKLSVSLQGRGLRDCGGLAFDVGQDGSNLWDILMDVSF